MRLPQTPSAPLFWLALMRLMLGLMFLTTWGNNARRGYYTPDGFLQFINTHFPQSENPLTFYAGFITNVILPARAVFAPFQLLSEGLVAVALLLGVLTPLTSVAAAFFLGNVFLMTFGQDWPWAYLMPISLLGVFFFTRAGRVWGVDAWLLQRVGPRGWLW